MSPRSPATTSSRCAQVRWPGAWLAILPAALAVRVFFYGRPGKPRNLFELGVTADVGQVAVEQPVVGGLGMGGTPR